MDAPEQVMKLLKGTGITLNGTAPQDIIVHNEKFYGRVLRGGSLALGESYMDGWWDAKRLDLFFYHILKADLVSKVHGDWRTLLLLASYFILNLQIKRRAFIVGERHYDIGNDLYLAMLDKNLTYTCGYWAQASNLQAAQDAKLDLVCRKIGLKKGDKVLDIGCGWGSFAAHAAKHYGAHVVGITVSKEQVALANKMTSGLPVEIKLLDYRDVKGTFNHVVSLGMFEHVGSKNYRTYMQLVHDHLRDDGLFLLHTIGRNTTGKNVDPWLNKYIFPNSKLPSIREISGSVEKIFVMEDWHNFGADYYQTLMSWHANVERAWPQLPQRYNDRFHRMWTYYLLSCAGSFRARSNQLWQIVLSKKGVKAGYQSVR